MCNPVKRPPAAPGSGPRPGRPALLAASLCLASLLGLSGCAAWTDGPAYWWQSAAGHLDLIRRAEPASSLIADPATDPQLRERLQRALEIRGFASRELALPENDSYTRYVAIDRPFVVWNVFAAPPLSLKLRQSCFPVAGCVGYRGYFSREDAERFAQRMRDEGFEAFVSGVPAYSTLGWFADPLLSSFVNRHEVELARLVFHELAHQRVYLKGDSTFNESYATAVERIGLERWLDARIASGADPRLRETWREHSARRADFLALLRRHRESLERLFASGLPDAEKLAGRDAVFAALQADYAALRERWGGFAGYDRWFGQRLTTAHLASVAAYNDLVPAFEALLAREAGDLTRFHRAAEALAKLPAPQRKQSLAGLAAGNAREPGKIASNRPAAAAP